MHNMGLFINVKMIGYIVVLLQICLVKAYFFCESNHKRDSIVFFLCLD